MKSALALHTGSNDASITLFYTDGSTKTVSPLVYDTLTPEDKIVYDNYRDMLPQVGVIFMDNFPISVDGDMNVPGIIDPSTRIDLDYNTISVGDKAKSDAFVVLIEKLFI